MAEGEGGLGEADHGDGLGGGDRDRQRVRIGQADVLAGGDHQAAGDEAGVLAGLDHPGQIVQGGVDVGAADGLDQGAGHVVVLVAVAVVLHGGPVDRLLQGGQADLRLALVQGGSGGRLQGGEGAAGVTAGDAQEVALGLPGEGDGALEAALVGEGALDEALDVVVGERFEGEQQGAGQQRRDHREVRVLRRRRDQRHPAVLDGREQGVLLGLAEAVDLVQEEDGLLAVSAGGAAGAVDDRADLLDSCGDRRQFDEAGVGGLGDDVRQGGLAGAGRAPEDHGGGAGGTGGLADKSAQGRARLQQMLLAHDLVEGARAHPHRQGAAGRLLLLAFFCCGGEQVGLHVRNPKSRH